MAVISGVIEKISEGIWLPMSTTFHRVTIGRNEIRKLVIYNDMKDGFQVGQDVSISLAKISGNNIVMAMKLSDGTVERAHGIGTVLALEAFGKVLLFGFLAFVIASASYGIITLMSIPIDPGLLWLIAFAILIYAFVVKWWLNISNARNAFK